MIASQGAAILHDRILEGGGGVGGGPGRQDEDCAQAGADLL